MKYYDHDLDDYVYVDNNHVFLGDCFGVLLEQRGKNDKHICFRFLTEDDETWSISKNGFSSYWLPEAQEQITAALEWMKNNAIKDSNGYGYSFK